MNLTVDNLINFSNYHLTKKFRTTLLICGQNLKFVRGPKMWKCF